MQRTAHRGDSVSPGLADRGGFLRGTPELSVKERAHQRKGARAWQRHWTVRADLHGRGQATAAEGSGALLPWAAQQVGLQGPGLGSLGPFPKGSHLGHLEILGGTRHLFAQAWETPMHQPPGETVSVVGDRGHRRV